MISDIENFFIFLLASCISSLENCLFEFLAKYKRGYFGIEFWKSLLYFGDKAISNSVDCLFTFDCYFCCAEAF